MDGLRSIFNERSRYICLWYVSSLHPRDIGELTTAEIVQRGRFKDELLNGTLDFYQVQFSEMWLDEREFHLTMKSCPPLGCLDIGSSRLPPGPPMTNQWISCYTDPISEHVDSMLDESFQRLAATWLIITKNGFPGIEVDGFQYAQSVAGSQLLQCLEKTLSSSSLSNLGAETLRALMRILLFTVSVVIWSRPRFQTSPVSIFSCTHTAAANEERSSMVGNNNSFVFSRIMCVISESGYITLRA